MSKHNNSQTSEMVNNSEAKIGVQRTIFLSGIILFIIKVIAFVLTNSVGILSDALESTVNIITGYLTLKALHFAAKPRDEDHPYGHGKVELLTASVEGILIGIAGIMIITEAIKRLGTPPVISKLDTGIILMVLTAVANYLLGMYSIRKGKKMQSIGLISGGKHLMSDTYTTMALVGGLLIYYFTGYQWVDSVLAITFGTIILYTGYEVLKSTVNGLMDEADINAINGLVDAIRDERTHQWVNIHKLTYLKFGNVSHVDFHLTLPFYFDMNGAATEINRLKGIIRSNLPEEDVDISIQSEPCTTNMCYQCQMECVFRKSEFIDLRSWTTEEIIGKNIYRQSINKQLNA